MEKKIDEMDWNTVLKNPKKFRSDLMEEHSQFFL